MSPLFPADIDLNHSKAGGNKDMHNTLHEFEVLPDGITDYGVSCP